MINKKRGFSNWISLVPIKNTIMIKFYFLMTLKVCISLPMFVLIK